MGASERLVSSCDKQDLKFLAHHRKVILNPASASRSSIPERAMFVTPPCQAAIAFPLQSGEAGGNVSKTVDGNPLCPDKRLCLTEPIRNNDKLAGFWNWVT